MTRPIPTIDDWRILEKHGVTPDNLHVGWGLDLSHTPIAALPDNLHVDGWLNLSFAAITALPDNLHVGGDLDLYGTSITALPDNLHVGRRLDLSGTSITALPDNLHVGGVLYLHGTNIKPLLTDERGYRLDRAGDRYIAGCRNFSAEEALAHWGSETYPDRARGDRYVAAIKAEESRRATQ